MTILGVTVDAITFTGFIAVIKDLMGKVSFITHMITEYAATNTTSK